MQALVYSLVCALRLEAALTHQVDLGCLSFKGTVDTLRSGRRCSLRAPQTQPLTLPEATEPRHQMKVSTFRNQE